MIMTMAKGWISSGRGSNSGLAFARVSIDVYKELAGMALRSSRTSVCSVCSFSGMSTCYSVGSHRYQSDHFNPFRTLDDID